MSDYGKQEIHHRYFYHLRCCEKTKKSWQHGEKCPSDEINYDGNFRHIFHFYWADINQLPELIADHDFYVEKLHSFLRLNEGKTEQK